MSAAARRRARPPSSKKLHDLIKATGEYTIEAWVAPGNVAQEESRIVSYSGGITARNFMLGQTLYSYDFIQPLEQLEPERRPEARRPSADDEDLQATLQHVVATYDPVNGRRIYVNGEFTGDVDPVAGGTLGDWDDTFAFVLGNEVSGDRQFQGVFRIVAIYNRAITPAQITQNFQAGVGEKFYLLFSVSHLVDMPQAYVMFEVSQFDSYGYLFDKPTFISLDAAATPGSIPVAGIRIGVNGAEAHVGQAYRTLDTVVNDSNYGPGGQRLSAIGTVIALEKGPEFDEFFLTFDVLGDHTNVRTDPIPLAACAAARRARARRHRHARVRRDQRDDVRAHRRQHAEPGRRGDLRLGQAERCRRSRPSIPSSRRTRLPSLSSRSSTATRW